MSRRNYLPKAKSTNYCHRWAVIRHHAGMPNYVRALLFQRTRENSSVPTIIRKSKKAILKGLKIEFGKLQAWKEKILLSAC